MMLEGSSRILSISAKRCVGMLRMATFEIGYYWPRPHASAVV